MNEQIKTKQNNNILLILLIILLVVLITIGVFLLLKDNNQDNGKIDNNSNINTTQNESISNSYKTYFENLKKDRKTIIISNIDDVKTPFEKIGIESIMVTTDGVAKIEGAINGQKEINNILAVSVFPIGNAGFRAVVFIKEDGTLLALDIKKLVNEKKIEYITNFGSIKDIITLTSFSNIEKDPIGGGVASIKAIDINGNSYDLGEYLLGSDY